MSELLDRQRLMLPLSHEEATEMIIDCAMHIALVFGGTVPRVLGDCVAAIPWSKDEWEEMADNFRSELGLDEDGQ